MRDLGVSWGVAMGGFACTNMLLGVAMAAAAALGCGAPRASKAPARQVAISPPKGGAPTDPAPPRRTGDTAREALEARCYAAPWEPAEAKDAPQPLSPATRERLSVLQAECRDTHPELPPGRFAAVSRVPEAECHYGIARIYFEERRYADAARWFHRVAVEHADEDMAFFAAVFYLQSLDVLWSRSSSKRAECRQLMLQDARRLGCAYCRPGGAEEECVEFRRFGSDAGVSQPLSCPP